MKKALSSVLAFVFAMVLVATALAVDEGVYAWNDRVIIVQSVNTQPMFSPSDMTEDQYPVAVELVVPDEVWDDEALYDALYAQAKLVDKDGVAYAPGAATTKDKILTLLFAVNKGTEVDALAMQFVATQNIPAEYVGDWAGHVDNIDLTFHVGADGAGTYTFEQGGYKESYDFALAVDSETFSVEIPKDNQLNILAIEGTYAYDDGVLTLDVKTRFATGQRFEYTVPCEKVDVEATPTDAPEDTTEGEKANVFPVEYLVAGKIYTLEGYQIKTGDDGNTVVSFRGNGIVLLQNIYGKTINSVYAVFYIAGERHEVQVSSYTMLTEAPLSALSTTALTYDMEFKLNTTEKPEEIVLLNTTNSRSVISFLVADVDQMSGD